MTHAALAMVLLAPARQGASSGGFHLSSSTLIIVAIVVILGAMAIWGFRPSDRSPGSDDKAQRDRIEH
jgi:hypothetical protein